MRKNYEDACNAYLRAFCQKHGYDEDDAVNSWETAFGEWYDYCLRLHMIRRILPPRITETGCVAVREKL